VPHNGSKSRARSILDLCGYSQSTVASTAMFMVLFEKWKIGVSRYLLSRNGLYMEAGNCLLEHCRHQTHLSLVFNARTEKKYGPLQYCSRFIDMRPSSSSVYSKARFNITRAASSLISKLKRSLVFLQSAGMPLGNVCVSIRYPH
jgi:hypothetical protein